MISKPLRIAARIGRIILAVTFIVSGFTKAVDPWGTAIKIDEYLSIYGFEYLQSGSMAFSIWLCGAELMMGCMLLCKVRIRLISIFAFASMCFFTALTLISATVLPVEDCGCFGDAVKLTPWQTFFKNLTLLPLAALVWWRYRFERIFDFTRCEVVLTLCFFGATMGLGVWCYRHLPLIDFLPYKVGVNIREAMEETPENRVRTVLVYREKATGRVREFAVEDPQWQDESRWEWVDTRVEEDRTVVRPLVAEFAVRDAEGDATQELLDYPGHLYMICVTRFDGIGRRCVERLAALVERAEREHARVVCLTPEPLRSVRWHSFAGSTPVRCYNVDATTLKTMLRAYTGAIELLDGTIVAKSNCRDIPL